MSIKTSVIKSSAVESSHSVIQPTVLLDFKKGKGLPSKVVFSRNSTATYIDKTGILKIAQPGVPRITYNPNTKECLGLLIENDATNLMTNSEKFDDTPYSPAGLTIHPNTNISPDGHRLATRIVEGTTNSLKYILYNRAGSTETAVASVFAKAGERYILRFGFTDYVDNFYEAYFNLNNGTILGTDSTGIDYTNFTSWIEYYGNGWYRCFIRATKATVTSINNGLEIGLTANNTTRVYTGDGSSGLYVWGVQFSTDGVQSSYIPSSMSFISRASSASYIDQTGTIKTAPTNVARYNFSPLNQEIDSKLLLEPSSTNLFTYSEDITNAAWTKTNISTTSNSIASPDGTTTADIFYETSATGIHFLSRSLATTANLIYTFSVFIKAKEYTYGVIEISDGQNTANYFRANYNLVTSTISNFTSNGLLYAISSDIVPYLNGWYRLSFTYKITNGSSTSTAFSIYLKDNTSRVGDGVSGLYIWGAQFEQNNSATNYIKTTSSQVTRSADVYSSSQVTRIEDTCNIPNIEGINLNEGSLYFEANTYANYFKTDQSNRLMCYLQNSNTNRFYDNSIAFWVWNDLSNFHYLRASVTYNNLYEFGDFREFAFANIINSNAKFKSIIAYNANTRNLQVTINGGNTSNSTTSIPAVNKLNFGNGVYGVISKIVYYPKQLSSIIQKQLTTL
jgi:hypothetical protein